LVFLVLQLKMVVAAVIPSRSKTLRGSDSVMVPGNGVVKLNVVVRIDGEMLEDSDVHVAMNVRRRGDSARLIVGERCGCCPGGDLLPKGSGGGGGGRGSSKKTSAPEEVQEVPEEVQEVPEEVQDAPEEVQDIPEAEVMNEEEEGRAEAGEDEDDAPDVEVVEIDTDDEDEEGEPYFDELFKDILPARREGNVPFQPNPLAHMMEWDIPEEMYTRPPEDDLEEMGSLAIKLGDYTDIEEDSFPDENAPAPPPVVAATEPPSSSSTTTCNPVRAPTTSAAPVAKRAKRHSSQHQCTCCASPPLAPAAENPKKSKKKKNPPKKVTSSGQKKKKKDEMKEKRGRGRPRKCAARPPTPPPPEHEDPMNPPDVVELEMVEDWRIAPDKQRTIGQVEGNGEDYYVQEIITQRYSPEDGEYIYFVKWMYWPE
jgi:hypothetical protein